MKNVENVVVVVIDALRADRVGCVGSGGDLTPNLDAIAADGTVFDRAFTCASNTDPAVTSLLTGRYPLNSVLHHGKLVTDEEKRRIESIPPVPDLLADAGWDTVAIGQGLGRWHARGFDHYPDAGMNDRLRSRATAVARHGYDVVDQVLPPVARVIRRLYGVRNRGLKPDVVMQDYDPTELLSWTDSSPFFGFVHLMDTHMPYLGTTEDFDDLVDSGDYPTMTVEEFLKDSDPTQAQVDRLEDAIESLGLGHLGEILALYDAAVRYADRKVGNLVAALREADRWEDTALFVTADHGESLLEHGIFLDHHGLYDEVFHVPLLTNLGDGSRVTEFVQHMDLAPTVLDLLSMDGPAMDGRSLVPILSKGDSWESRPAVFAEEAYTERRTVVRTRDWKHIRHRSDSVLESERGSSLECAYCDTIHGSPDELFDLSADAGEQLDVSQAQPEEVSELSTAYESFVDGLVEPADSKADVRYENEEDVLDRLEAIGYR